MTVYFTSDLHFGHRLVADHRGFGDDTATHDQALMDRWRSVVKRDDQVWVLGDLSLIDPEYAFGLVRQLPGVKHFIAGNHDPCHPMHRQAHKFQRRYLEVFASVQPFARRRIDGEEVLLSHFPYSRDRGTARYMQYRLPNQGKWLLHGHTHGSERLTLQEGWESGISGYIHPVREIHVGVDAWDLTPVSLDQVVDLMREGAH